MNPLALYYGFATERSIFACTWILQGGLASTTGGRLYGFGTCDDLLYLRKLLHFYVPNLLKLSHTFSFLHHLILGVDQVIRVDMVIPSGKMLVDAFPLDIISY